MVINFGLGGYGVIAVATIISFFWAIGKASEAE